VLRRFTVPIAEGWSEASNKRVTIIPGWCVPGVAGYFALGIALPGNMDDEVYASQHITQA